MSAARSRARFRATLALVVGVTTLLVPLTGQAPAAGATCPQYRVIAARGSGQSVGKSPEINNTLKYLTLRANATGVTLDTSNAELTKAEYLALAVQGDWLNREVWDELGPAASFTGIGAFFHSGPYQDSVTAGITSVKSRLTQLSIDCKGATKAILVGYSQGAEVMHRVEDTASGAERSLIAGFIGYGDPWFSPSDPAAVGSFDSRRHGLLNGQALPSGFANVTVCHARDPICQGFRPTLDPWEGFILGIDIGQHTNYGGDPSVKDTIGETAGAVNALGRKLNWTKPAVGPGTGGPLDLVFTIDTTGSMGDDIAAVQQSMNDTVDRLDTVSTSWRVAVVDYKDDPETQGDPYRSRLDLAFTNNVTAIRNAIASLDADGGGDEPESVYSGMMLGLSQPWRSTARRSLIVMGDAAAQDPEPGTGYRLSTVTAKAASVTVVNETPGHLRAMAPGDPAAFSASAFPVVVGGDPDAVHSMGDIAAGTNGRAFTSPESEDVPDAVSAAVSAAGIGLVAAAGGPYTGSTQQSVAFSGADSASVTDDIVSYAWDFGDGETAPASASPLASHQYEESGDYTAKLTVKDASGLTSVASAQVTVVDEPTEAPAAPTEVTAVANDDGTVDVSWIPDPDYAGDVSGFLITASDGSPVGIAQGDEGQTTLTGLPVGVPVSVRVSQVGPTKTSSAAAADKVVTPHHGTRLTLGTPPRVTHGQKTKITGRLSTASGDLPVTGLVQVSTRRHGTRTWGAWRTATKRTSSGKFVAKISALPKTSDLRVRFPGSAGYLSSISGARVASVAYRVTATRSKAVVKPNKTVRISGAVSPGAGVAVVLQQRVGHSWASKSSKRTNKRHRYAFTIRPTKVGTFSYRVVAKAGGGLVSGHSSGVSVRVKK